MVLAWHVEYWDYLGWRDPFAHASHTERQKRYARALGAKGLVTPQILVANADTRGKKIGEAIAAAAEQPARLAIDGRARHAQGKVEVEVRLRKLDPALALEPAVKVRPVLFQRTAVTACTAGENQGAKLEEHFVVRQALGGIDPAVALSDAGARFAFDLPEGVPPVEWGVAVLVEDEAAMKTLECRALEVEADPPPAGK